MNPENIIQMARGAKKAEAIKKPEKSQEELREILEQKLKNLKPSLQEGIKEYEQALEDGFFENTEGEDEKDGEKRKEVLQNKIDSLFDRAEKMKKKLDSKEKLSQMQEEISVEYSRPDGHQETINLSLENKLQEFLSLYQKTKLDLPPDFEETIREIWEKNQDEMEKAIQEKGFDDMLIIPENIPLSELSEKMKMESGYYTGSNFDEGGGFAGAKNQNADKARIILIHKKTLPKIQKENGLDVHLNIKAGDALNLFEKNPEEHMNLADFVVMERKIFEESGIHISDYNEKSGQWLNTKSGARLVCSLWSSGRRGLDVGADDLEDQNSILGVRPSRCFF